MLVVVLVCFKLTDVMASEVQILSVDLGTQRPIIATDLLLIRDIGSSGSGSIAVSPDGDRLAFSLRQADLETNSYRTSWFVVELAGERRSVNAGSGGEPIFVLNPYGIRVGTLTNETAKWSPDGRWFVYRLKKDDSIQLWRSRSDGKVQEQLTNNASDVESFAWAGDGKRIFFQVGRSRVSRALADKEEGERGHLFDARFVPFYSNNPLWGSCSPSPFDRMPASRACQLSLWVLDFETGAEREATAQELSEYNDLISGNQQGVLLPDRDIRSTYLSPDGKWIAWLENESPEAYPGMGAPLTIFASGSGETRCPATECHGHFAKLGWSESGSELYMLRKEGIGRSTRAFYGWNPSNNDVRPILQTSDLITDCHLIDDRAVCLHESPKSPRSIVSIDLLDGRMDVLVDPNPEYRNIQFTQVERREWQDGFGNDTFGHLIYPSDYQQGRRYPLIIVQYRSRGFLRGGTGDEYPIHLLARNGFVVLSFDRPADYRRLKQIETVLEWEKDEWADLYERRRALTALDTIIDRLDDEGIIDPDRVGITGLSDGAETLYFSLIHTDRFAAASASAGSWEQVFYYLSGDTFLREYLPYVGLGRPGGPDDKHWLDNAVSLNTDRISTPLLMQVADHELTAAGVETFVSLKEAGKPVEMRVFPDEYHVKWQPKHRLNIYRRNVQWFDFWLRGVEDPEPVDPEQYVRWHKLREQHDANQRAVGQAQ